MDRAVLATAAELYAGRHYPSVVALVSDALVSDPENIALLLLRARSRMALRLDVDAQTDLRHVIRIDPRCGLAYRLLGVLAARRDENESAAILFAEALRLDPDDIEADTWLAILRGQSQRTPRFALGTHNERVQDEDKTPVVARHAGVFRAYPAGDTEDTASPTKTDEPPRTMPSLAQRAPVPTAIPEAPGFGDYLVEIGILTRERLRAAQAYQRSMRVQLSAAVVALGLASPQRIEWAAVAHQSTGPRARRQ